MDDHIFIDREYGIACHLTYRFDDNVRPWTVRFIDSDSNQTIELRRFASENSAIRFIQQCLPNVEI